jgi:hypothetical protein
MPRYFFDIWDSDRKLPDTEGTYQCDLEAAMAEALKMLDDIGRDTLASGGHKLVGIDIHCGDGMPRVTVSLSVHAAESRLPATSSQISN